MKIIRSILRGICFLFLFLLCGAGFRFLLTDDTSSYTRLMMHEFYEQDQIDILFVGSSHCYAALDPEITDSIFGKNTFNAGSSLQAQDASFALIREAAERYNVEQIYMEMYYLMMSNADYRKREQMTGIYIISDYMRPSLNKARFLLEASSPKYYVNSFLPPRRDWERLLDPPQVLELVRKKQTREYREYQPFGNYKGKGFVANQGGNPGGLLLDNAGFDRIHPENASPDWLKTLREIIDYCEKKQIRLTLFSAPMTLFQTAGAGNYDAYEELVREIIAGSDVRYVDFNRCRETYFDQKPEYFADAGHLNADGAEVFSRVFSEYFTGQIPDGELFYDSMAEKIAAAGPQILGLSFLDSGDGMRKLKIVSTAGNEAVYSVLFTNEDGTEEWMLEDSPDPFFELPQGTHGTVQITVNGISAEMEI